MLRPLGAGLAFAATCALVACGGKAATTPGGESSGFVPAMPFAISFVLPKNTIGEELPSEGVGTKTDPTWGKVGGFTQTTKAQVLAFPPNTKITIHNLSRSIPHTLDVFANAGTPPAHFPSNPTLPIAAKNGGKFELGYASGSINPGKSVTATLVKAGKYLIGCAFHYGEGMRDVIIVKTGATPGPLVPH